MIQFQLKISCLFSRTVSQDLARALPGPKAKVHLSKSGIDVCINAYINNTKMLV